jgi:hypothetical protein
MSMPKGPFLPSEFVSTKFSTAADKADFGNAFLHFIESGWKETLFTKTFYNRLSNTFGHIAHYVEDAIMRSVKTRNRVEAALRHQITLHNPSVVDIVNVLCSVVSTAFLEHTRAVHRG